MFVSKLAVCSTTNRTNPQSKLTKTKKRMFTSKSAEQKTFHLRPFPLTLTKAWIGHDTLKNTQRRILMS